MASRPSRNVALTPEWDAFITDSMGSGDFANASEVVRAGLRALRDGTRSRTVPAYWPIGGGDCGAIVRQFDWAASALGPVDGWSLEMRATVANVVNSPVAKALMWGPDRIMIYNDAFAAIAGSRHPGIFGLSAKEAFPEIWDFHRDVTETVLRGKLRSYRDQPLTLEREAGPERLILDLFYTPVFDADGRVGGVLCTGVDNSVRCAAETESERSNGRFRTAMRAVHGILWTNTPDGRMEGDQPGWSALTGQGYEQYRGFGWAEAVHPDDRDPTIVAWNHAVATRSPFIHEHRICRHDHVWRTCAVRALPILDDDGQIVEWVGVHTDITHQRAAEAALRDQAKQLTRQVGHRERAEEQLRQMNATLEARVIAEISERRDAEAKLAQAQKMESVGKLTGGVAHDFNNLLQVVSGNLQLLAKDIAGNVRAEKRVENAMAGVSRGAKLASQLLAFGRRSALEPKVINATRFVREMEDILRRAIGETIEIRTVVSDDLWNTFIDPAQIENALLNLAINARDAMEGQGRLTIELDNADLDSDYALIHDEVAPGQYVMLAVTDTGSGMTPDIVDKVFEPFFSTKAEGKGSGLGLSMVYGFVKQSGGHVKIYSEVGHGTTVRLYLPRAMAVEDRETVADTGPVVGGSETVLVVEDDDAVRTTVVEMLGDLGYRVLKATDANAALNIVESGVPIDLLFTDVVMPGSLKSPELARLARKRLPDIAILFTSGYTQNSIVHDGKLDDGIELLSKPYTREALARRFRHVLANCSQRRAASAPPPVAAPRDNAIQATVLLVEDDPLILRNTADMLKQIGCVVVEAGSAEDALAALQTAAIDVLVTDLNLPGGSGATLAARARDQRGSIGIVFATGDAAHAKKAAEVGDVIIAKPYDLADLRSALGQALVGVGRHETKRTADV
ncbi:MAG: response regulator [Sphingomonas bacterium]|nr:response regulator [Sphingomonas bacterium]